MNTINILERLIDHWNNNPVAWLIIIGMILGLIVKIKYDLESMQEKRKQSNFSDTLEYRQDLKKIAYERGLIAGEYYSDTKVLLPPDYPVHSGLYKEWERGFNTTSTMKAAK